MTSGKEHWNKNVLRCRRNECSDWADVTSLGRLFHTQGTATGKAWLPTDDSLTGGTIRQSVLAERRARRPGTSATRTRDDVTSVSDFLLSSTTLFAAVYHQGPSISCRWHGMLWHVGNRTFPVAVSHFRWPLATFGTVCRLTSPHLHCSLFLESPQNLPFFPIVAFITVFSF